MEVEFRPSPENLIRATRLIEHLATLMSDRPAAAPDDQPPREGHVLFPIDSLIASWRFEIMQRVNSLALVAHTEVGIDHPIWTVKDQNGFVRVAKEWQRCCGWSELTTWRFIAVIREVLLWARWNEGQQMTEDHAQRIIAAAQTVRVEAEQKQAELDEAIARERRRTANIEDKKQIRRIRARDRFAILRGDDPHVFKTDLVERIAGDMKLTVRTVGKYLADLK